MPWNGFGCVSFLLTDLVSLACSGYKMNHMLWDLGPFDF